MTLQRYGGGQVNSVQDDEETRRRQQAQRGNLGTAGPGGAAEGTGQVGTLGGSGQVAGPTFAQMQREGYARPAQPRPGANEALMAQGRVEENRQSGGGWYGMDRRRPGAGGPGGGGGQIQPVDAPPLPHPIPPQQPGGSPSQPPPPQSPQPPAQTPGGGGPGGGGGSGPVPRPNHPFDPRPDHPLTPTPDQPFSDLGQRLQQMITGYQGSGNFVDLPSAVNTPRGYNPSAYGGQYTAVDAPILRQTGAFSAPGSSFGNQLETALAGQLQNPSSFNSDAVQSMFSRLSGQIDDEYTQKDRYLQEDMAKRGLAESSIRGGRMADLNVEKRSAKTELADRLLERMAQTGSADTRAAIQQAMGYDESQFGRGLQSHQANLGTNQQNFQQDLVTRAFMGDQQAMELVKNMDVQGFNNAAGQQGFQNEMARAGFTADQNQQGYQNRLTNFQANLGAGQQNFNQMQTLLASLMGYNQQGFGNEMERARFTSDNDFRNRQLAAAMASLGL